MDDPQAVELDRIRRAAFNITSTFEGSKTYANYQNYDAGIISYGRFQFTLSGGALVKVVNYYLASSTSHTATELRGYQARIQARDATLRDDEALRGLLIAAAAEPAMRAAQDRVVMESYWAPARDSITSRGITTPLGQALLFDMAVQHGPANKLTQTAETQLGAPPKSLLGQNGLNEQQLITQVAKVRQEYLYDFAEKNNLAGVTKRGDFWVALVGSGDWQLQGDSAGNVIVYNKPVQVKEPPGEKLADPTHKSGMGPAPDELTAHAALSLKASTASENISTDVPPAEPGHLVNGTFISSEVLPIYDAPNTGAVLQGRVTQGKELTVSRQHMPSPDEEWLLTEVGWVARRLSSAPGVIFGSLTLT